MSRAAGERPLGALRDLLGRPVDALLDALGERRGKLATRAVEEHLYSSERLSMGRCSYGEPLVATFTGDSAHVRVGAFTSIGPDVILMDGGDHRTDWVSTFPFRAYLELPGAYEDGHPRSRGDIEIGNDVWIGRGARVRSGVKVGDGAVIGAYSVLTRDVRPYAVVAGVPARELRRRFSDEQVQALQRIAWWEWPMDAILASVAQLCNEDVDAFIREHLPGWLAEPDPLERGGAGQAALRGSILRSGSYILAILLSLISARVLITHLGVSSFGRYTAVVALVTIVGGFTEGGLNSVVLREFAILDEQRRRRMMGSAIGMRMVLTICGVVLAVAFAAVAPGYSTAEVAGTALAGVGLVFQLLQSTLSMTLQAQLRFGWVSAAEILRQIVNVGLLVVFALAGAGLLPLLAVAIPASIVSLAFTLPLVIRYTSLRPSFDLARWWLMLRETIPWAVIAAVSIVYFRVALVLMSLIASPAQTGYFATSFRISEVLVGIPGLVISVAFPILARAAREDAARFSFAAGRIFALALFAGTWLVLSLEVGAGFAIHVIAAHKADPSIEVLRIQGLSLIASFVAVACGYPLLMMRRYREVLSCNLLALAISAILTLSLVPSLGARGAALAALIAEIGLGLSQAVMLKRAAPDVPLPLSTVAAVALAGGAGAAVGLLLPVHPIIGVIVAGLVYCSLLKLLGRFPPEVREVLAGVLGGPPS